MSSPVYSVLLAAQIIVFVGWLGVAVAKLALFKAKCLPVNQTVARPNAITEA